MDHQQRMLAALCSSRSCWRAELLAHLQITAVMVVGHGSRAAQAVAGLAPAAGVRTGRVSPLSAM